MNSRRLLALFLLTGTLQAQPTAPPRQATPAEALKVPEGFKIELIASAGPEDGSWVALTRDAKGRLIISPQFGKPGTNTPQTGLIRMALTPEGKVARRDLIGQPLYDAQGLVYAHDSIYAVVNKYSSSYQSGLYRLKDKGDDQYGDIQLVKKFPGSGEHGPHAVQLGPDGKLYVMVGNHTKVLDGISPHSPHRNYGEDHLLPRQWDGNGHAAGILAPGGHILRADAEGKNWEIFCGGFRNAYDFAFNVDGEIFTYDSDMEWDWGMPWYRPTRVNHCVSGGEYGWRSGTGKWPQYYPDSLPAIDIGIGSPTGVDFGTGAKFPAKYQAALYIMDWTYGRLMAVHLKPDGATYTGVYENFVAPAGLVEKGAEKRPLNLTDLVIGNDGAMYFVTGGRNTQAGLYRVSYIGNESTAPATLANQAGQPTRALRHRLESFHGRQDPQAVATVWPHLGSEDRFIRYAARIALEAQPVSEWKDKAVAEKNANAALTALLALARVGGPETQSDLAAGLKNFPFDQLSEAQQIEKLRIIELSFIRQARPDDELRRLAISRLSPLYPAQSEAMNHELAQLLIYLGAPDVIDKTLPLLTKAKTQEEEIFYLFHLRTAKPWNAGQLQTYLPYFARERNGMAHPPEVTRWFKEAGRPYSHGSSYANFMKNFYNSAVTNLPLSQRTEVETLIAEAAPTPDKPRRTTTAAAEKRTFVKEWRMADFASALERPTGRRNFEKGKAAFASAQCLACHKFGNEGGGVGPDLTAVASRFSRRDILESTLEPSRVVSEQFQNVTITKKDGDDVTGRVVDENAERLTLVVNPLAPESKTVIAKKEIARIDPARLSPMPEGLVNILTHAEVLDLLAYLESGGNPAHAVFNGKLSEAPTGK